MCTVQAPHCATPQPYFVPVRPTCSRDRPQQRRVVVDVYVECLTVDGQPDHFSSSGIADDDTRLSPESQLPHRAERGRKARRCPVVHAHEPIEPGLPHFGALGRAVDVDVAAHGVDVAEAVFARFAARKPQNAGQNPVPARVFRMQLRTSRPRRWDACARIPCRRAGRRRSLARRCAGRAGCRSCRSSRLPLRLAVETEYFSVPRVSVPQGQLLLRQVDFDLHRLAAKNCEELLRIHGKARRPRAVT